MTFLSSVNYKIINTKLAGHVTDFQFKIHLLGTHILCFLLGQFRGKKEVFYSFEL